MELTVLYDPIPGPYSHLPFPFPTPGFSSKMGELTPVMPAFGC